MVSTADIGKTVRYMGAKFSDGTLKEVFRDEVHPLKFWARVTQPEGRGEREDDYRAELCEVVK